MSTTYRRATAHLSLKERIDFHSIPEPNTGCWLWTASLWGLRQCRYGQLYHDGQVRRAHRLSYIAYNGDVPAGMVVRHKCNQPSCVNPEHLLLGSAKDNVHDAIRSGRFVYNKRALGEDRAEQLRQMHRSGFGYIRLARAFGISPGVARKYALSLHSKNNDGGSPCP